MISILMPAYNTDRYISEALNSIANIQYDSSDFELVIYNDGSSDNTKQIICEFIKNHPEIKARLLDSRENRGTSHARNMLLENAQGDYIYWMDSDDVVSCDIFDKTIGYFFDNPQIGVVAFGYRRCDQHGECIKEQIPFLSIGEHSWDDYLNADRNGSGWYIDNWNHISRKDAWKGFRHNEEAYSDSLSYSEVYRKARLYVIHDILYTLRLRDGSISSVSDTDIRVPYSRCMSFFGRSIDENQKVAIASLEEALFWAYCMSRMKEYYDSKSIKMRKLVNNVKKSFKKYSFVAKSKLIMHLRRRFSEESCYKMILWINNYDEE